LTEYTPKELELVTKARQDERLEVMKLIEKFVRPKVLSDGDTISEIRVPANHLLSLIRARGEATDHILSGEYVDPTVLPE